MADFAVDANGFDLRRNVVFEWLVNGERVLTPRAAKAWNWEARHTEQCAHINRYVDNPSEPVTEAKDEIYAEIAKHVRAGRRASVRIIGAYDTWSEALSAKTVL